MRRAVPSLAVLPLLGVLATGCAGSQGAPPRLTPERDVGVTYRLSGAQAALSDRSWLASEQRLRVEFGPPDGSGGYTLIDARSRRAFMVSDAAHSVTILPLPAGIGIQDPVLRPDARFARLGEDRIAGASCVLWRVESREAPPARACITADGVLLRSETAVEGHRIAREAVGLRYGPQAPARFRPPADYMTIDLAEGAAADGSP